jgi:hypothetical protein
MVEREDAMRKGAILLGIALSCLLFTSASADDRFVSITIENQTPTFQVAPSIEVFGAPAHAFAEVSPNSFSYRFKVSDSDWFNTANIKLLWKGAFETKDRTKIDFEQRIILRLRRNFPDDFSFPIYFSNDRSQTEMSKLEHESNISQQFKVYFRGWQIAEFFRDANGPQHPLTKRSAKIFFGGAVRLAEEPKYFVIMSDEAEQFATEASLNVSARANLARSVYWEDTPIIDSLVAQGQCDIARSLLRALRRLKDSEPDRFAARYPGNPAILDEKERIISSRCSNS